MKKLYRLVWENPNATPFVSLFTIKKPKTWQQIRNYLTRKAHKAMYNTDWDWRLEEA